MQLLALHYSKCSKWSYSATVTAASVSETDCIPAAHCGWADQIVAYTWTLKVASESRVTRATSVPILVFLGLSVLDLGPMYAIDRRQTRVIA